ncbi:type VI secretion system baseplate subunit TssG [Roseomonas alkaliterrae]|uniref:Type VI secretion system protein ImpH n=1 Tax=Neoroseomonas alkaliterrae TaxID=1452450 RepID=A0A840XRT0_9PROT|nr:type VI secretion system protein ImpH [Neoroseomonas alkaliterrae]MBR0677930.1 type VI secretion system baseplate subunit TssG [Neoroseomonas alkaliterrae]
MSGPETPASGAEPPPSDPAPEAEAPPALPDIAAMAVATEEAAAATRPPPEPPPSPVLIALSPVERLRREPARFDIDQAAMIALAASGLPRDEPEELRLRTGTRLAMPGGAVLAAKPAEGELTLGTFGLTGAGGALPRHHSAMVAAEQRKRSLALHAFLDMLGRRTTGLYVKAGAKYRPTRNPEPTERALSAAIGMATPHLVDRLRLPKQALLYHAGNLAARSRSAERLRAMLEAETGRRVEIEEFAGGFIRLPESEQTRLPKGRDAPQHAALGVSAAAGAQVWDPQARLIIRFGPLGRAEFESLLPGTPAWLRITQLARLFVGPDTAFAVNLVLRADEVPAANLAAGARLGWTSWMGASRPRRKDARDALFEPREVV